LHLYRLVQRWRSQMPQISGWFSCYIEQSCFNGRQWSFVSLVSRFMRIRILLFQFEIAF
jgi:hypothetical protein